MLQYGARILLGDEREKELLDIERELSVLKPKVSMLESRRDLLIAEKKRIEALMIQKENEDQYLVAAFSQVLDFQKNVKRISIKEHWIKKIYGIVFNVALVSENFQEALADLKLPASYLIEKYGIKKVGKGEREDKMRIELIEAKEAKE